MRKLFIASLALLPLLAAGADRSHSTPEMWRNAQPQLSINVKHGAQPETFDVITVVTDHRTGSILSEPRMTIKAGSWARVQLGATGAPGDVSLSLAVTVDPSGENAAYFAKIHRHDAPTDSESGTIVVSR